MPSLFADSQLQMIVDINNENNHGEHSSSRV